MSDDPKARGAPPEYVKVEKKRTAPWLWLVLAALAFALLLLLLSQCGHRRTAATTVPPVAAAPAAEVAPIVPAELGVSGLTAYIAGAEATPRTFVFEKLHFDTDKSVVRTEDEPEVDAAADALKAGSARVKIIGYADSSGNSAANQKLGLDRANAVKSAMVARGVDAGRIDTASGGEANPIASNATSGGRAENRRTELTVLQR